MLFRLLILLIAAMTGLTAAGLLFLLFSKAALPPLVVFLLVLLFLLETGTVAVLWLMKKEWGVSIKDPVLLSQETLEQERKNWEQQLEAESTRIDQQSRKLAERYRAINEWMNYPQILDLQSGDRLPGQKVELGTTRSPTQSQQLIRQDRAVRDILDAQAETIYEKIRKNEYAVAGQFQPLDLRDDLLATARKIAQVYQPQLENPLLSTSPEQIARALNRIGLHLLVVMDQLPLDLKSYNIQKTYDTIRHAINTYGAYKRASPYLDWASKGLYLGRMVTSTNPLALGVLWGATELGKIGAQKLATHLIDRQAIGLLQSVIRVVGYEVAAIYGGDIRYRDSNWCYAVELTQMLATFPASRESLQYGFQEIGRLQLRNEYDRLSVYRCLASGKVIDRRQTHPDLLTETERLQIVELLERAYHQVLHGQSSTLVEKWRKGVQEHLGVKLSLSTPGKRDHTSLQAVQNRQLLTFLIGFLHQIKSVPTEKLEQYFILFETPGSSRLINSTEALAEIINTLNNAENDGFFEFLPPDLDPTDPRVELFLAVLSRLNAALPPYSSEAEQMILETGFYYRQPQEQILRQIQDAYRDTAVSQIPEAAAILKEQEAFISRELLILQEESQLSLNGLRAVYRQLEIRFDLLSGTGTATGTTIDTASSSGATVRHFLAVFTHGVYLIRSAGLENLPEVIWQADSTVRLEKTSSMLIAEARVTGGKPGTGWTGPQVRSFKIQAPMTARFQQYFAPLIAQLNDTPARL